jgi:TM2 domain-containing membrane protein YozV
VYGLGVPGLGPKGIACGVLAKDEPDKKHLRFFTYAAALIFGGMFGLDSFLVGNKQRGIIRLVLLISFIFAPIALAWWGWNMVRFFTDTKQVVSEHAGYFGAASSSAEEEILARFPFLSGLFSPVQTITKIINEILQPFQQTAEAAIKTVDSVVKTADDALVLGKTAIEKGSNIVGEIAETVDKATAALSSASSALPGLDLYKSISPEGVAAAKQTGGAAAIAATSIASTAIATTDLNMLHFTLIGTIVLIAITGLTLTYYRSKNVRPTKDDTPPEPGVFRKPDSKERPT